MQTESAAPSVSSTDGQDAGLPAQASALNLDDSSHPGQAVTQHDTVLQPPSQTQAGVSETQASPPDNMDAIVEGLLIAGLHNLDDDELPMQTNEFYSKTVLGCKPPGKLAHSYTAPSLMCSITTCPCLLIFCPVGKSRPTLW